MLSISAHGAGATASSTGKKPSTAHASAKKVTRKITRKTSRTRRASWRTRGQRGIEPSRVREIQEALIREKYLDGEPDGVWGKASQEAMSRYQADHGWQTKVVPDARALIKLGLGPDRTAVINPESLQSSLVPQGGSQD
jgi:peptidoglycan hydrolase-like protein with peptidoglycan-binding domain